MKTTNDYSPRMIDIGTAPPGDPVDAFAFLLSARDAQRWSAAASALAVLDGAGVCLRFSAAVPNHGDAVEGFAAWLAGEAAAADRLAALGVVVSRIA